ncbi:hypothetical protein GDO86_020325 [Hymenochirus boettgeri]|uniref:Uncharacterized protein n=1 Tax=Hymenochirus boettgeri TaxID=247094 RepID=A0A8T2IKC4_9PIPI|nr:hypothetical protein GDO86_020325 [Hymenochirus boettgeri]
MNEWVGQLMCVFFACVLLHGGVFVVKKGYQEVDTSVQSSVITKLKGVAFTNTSELGGEALGVVDYVIPPQGENVFFIVTNVIVTPNRDREWRLLGGEAVIAGNGVKTGRCLKTGLVNTNRHCEYFAWGPVEKKKKPKKPLLGKAKTSPSYIKNSIRFPKFDFSK